ncbi:MAG: PCRF domain-containing protein, partial [Sphingorhabdus sp.]
MSRISPQRIAQIEARFAELEARMASGQMEGDAFVAASREYSELEPVAHAAKLVRRLRAEIDTLQVMVNEPGADAEMRDMAVEELQDISHQLSDAEQALAVALLPRDSADDRPAMLEIRAGTGGDEAALFAGDLFRMYTRYAEGMGWKVELISCNSAD